MKYLSVLLSICSLLLNTGCVNHPETIPSSAKRTVLVYLAGDNNLSGEVWQKIDVLTASWQNTQDNLLIYQDSRGEKGTPSLMKAVFDGTRTRTEVVREYLESNSADPQILSAVIRDVVKGFPAPSFGLMLFSHGTGWLPSGSYSDPRQYQHGLRSIVDDCGREMEIADLATAIPDNQFDFIVLEACLMANAEVAYELRNKADYLLASSAEILSPGFTPVYEDMLTALFAQPEAALTEVAQAYFTYCDKLETPYRSATVSVIRLDKMEELAKAMRKVYRLLPEEMESEEVKNIQCFDRSNDRLFFDMANLITSVDDKYAAQILQETVLYKSATPFFVSLPIRSHSGLTVYIPQSLYPSLNKAWKQTGWGKRME